MVQRYDLRMTGSRVDPLALTVVIGETLRNAGGESILLVRTSSASVKYDFVKALL